MKIFATACLFLFLPFLVSCALWNEWEQADTAHDEYRQCLERYGNYPRACTDHRESAQKAQQRYEERAKDQWCNPENTPVAVKVYHYISTTSFFL